MKENEFPLLPINLPSDAAACGFNQAFHLNFASSKIDREDINATDPPSMQKKIVTFYHYALNDISFFVCIGYF